MAGFSNCEIPLDLVGFDSCRSGEGPVMQKMYRDAFSADPKKQKEASPVHKVGSKPPPFLILHVVHRPDSARQSQLLAEALRKHGGRAEVTAIPGKNHGTISAHCGKKGDPVTLAIAGFLTPLPAHSK